MKRKTIALICAAIFACSGSVTTFATTSECQTTTEQGPRDSRTVRDASNRPTRTKRSDSGKTNDNRKVVPRKDNRKVVPRK